MYVCAGRSSENLPAFDTKIRVLVGVGLHVDRVGDFVSVRNAGARGDRDQSDQCQEQVACLQFASPRGVLDPRFRWISPPSEHSGDRTLTVRRNLTAPRTRPRVPITVAHSER